MRLSRRTVRGVSCRASRCLRLAVSTARDQVRAAQARGVALAVRAGELAPDHAPGRTRHVLHRVIEPAVGQRAAGEHLDDVRMVAAGQGAHLAAEAGQRHFVGRQVGRQHLQRHQPAQR